eukprot:g68119.t1
MKEVITKSKKLTGIVYDNVEKGLRLAPGRESRSFTASDVHLLRDYTHWLSLRTHGLVALHCNIDPNSIIMKWRTVEAYQQTYAIPAAIVPKHCLPENDTELASLVNSEEGQARLQETLRCLNAGIPVETLTEGRVSTPSFMLHPPVTQNKRGRPVKKRKEKGKGKKKTVTRCSRCYSTEHNARTCNEAVASTKILKLAMRD